MRLFFITDCDPDEKTGGAIIRRGQISFLQKEGIEVIVIKPGKVFNYSDETITVPGLVKNSKLYYGLESVGVIADKYVKWASNVVSYASQYINAGDILFATSGGTLAPIIAASSIKDKTHAKMIINYHDPTDFTTLHGSYSRKSKFPHVNRDRYERKLIANADFIITSSENYKDVLLEKYPQIKNNICCNYFGFIEDFDKPINNKLLKFDDYINIVYGGNFGPTQAPEILGLAAKGLNKIKVTYVGNYKSNLAVVELGKEPNVELLPAKPLSEYLDYLDGYADVGFFSLRNNLTNYCVPSKLFDYINLGLPMIGLVKGDASSIINTYGYGCTSADSVSSLREQLIEMSNIDFLQQCKENVIRDKYVWSMDKKVKEVVTIINNLNS